jgi:peptidoglycan/LPS O-acetylase OafA/YrhL
MTLKSQLLADSMPDSTTELAAAPIAELNPAITHIPQLDGVRGLAILLVIIVHCYYRGPGPTGINENVFIFGWTGVDLFFCLSGFLITNQLALSPPGGGTIKRFYARRFFRIFPLYYAFLLGVTALCFAPQNALTTPITADFASKWPWYFLYASNWMEAFNAGGHESLKLLGPLWSLSIEEQFYLLWPFVMVLLPKKARLPAVAISLAVGIGLRIALKSHLPAAAIYHATATHADSLLMGSALGLLVTTSTGKMIKMAAVFLLSTGAILLSYLYVSEKSIHYLNDGMQTFGYTATAMLWTGFIALTLCSKLLAQAIRIPPMRTLGKYSYFLYLAHWPALLLTSHMAMERSFLNFSIYTASITIALTGLAALSYKTFEYPMIKIGRKLFP